MNPPFTVRLAVVLTILSLLPGLVGFVIDQLVPGARTPIFGFWIVLGVGVLAFWSWIAWKTWRGRPWARMLQTILLPLGIATVVIGVVQGRTDFTWDDAIVWVISAATVVLLWTTTSRRHFAATSAARSRQKPDPDLKKPMNLS